MHFHTGAVANKPLTGSIFALHGITIGFEIAALAWGSAKRVFMFLTGMQVHAEYNQLLRA